MTTPVTRSRAPRSPASGNSPQPVPPWEDGPAAGGMPETGAGFWTELLPATAESCLAVLRSRAERDWSVPAAGLDWSCRQTLDHLALGLIGYAGLLIARPTDRYVTLFASLDPRASVDGCLEGIGIAASLLAATVRETAADVRAWHPWGHSDAAGFAAMGVTELSVHTYDMTRALGVAWSPPDETSTAVLARLFPDAPAGYPPWDTLLWCTGRRSLPGLGWLADWQWDGALR